MPSLMVTRVCPQVPELQCGELSGTVLQLKALGVDNVMAFDYLAPPPAEAMVKAAELLFALGAIDDAVQVPASRTHLETLLTSLVDCDLIMWYHECVSCVHHDEHVSLQSTGQAPCGRSGRCRLDRRASCPSMQLFESGLQVSESGLTIDEELVKRAFVDDPTVSSHRCYLGVLCSDSTLAPHAV